MTTHADDETPPAHPTAPLSDSRYDDLTLEEWRELMKSLDFQSPAASQAVPGLLSLVGDDDLPWYTRRQAALTLGRIGAPARAAVPELQRLLTTNSRPDEPSTTQWAAKAIALFGPVAAEATPGLITIMTDDTRPQHDRLVCIEALARIGGVRVDAIAALIELANADSTRSRDKLELQQAAIDGLSLIGSHASPAVPALIRLTSDDISATRKKAAIALGAIGNASGIAAESLAELVLFDELPEVRNAAVASLATIGERGTAALRQLLTDRDVTVRTLAANSLGKRIHTDDATTDALSAALQDTDDIVRIAAAEALWRTTKRSDFVTSAILDGLTSTDRQLRIRAYRLLLDLGPDAKSVLPQLRRLANDDRPHVRQVANKALQELEGSATNTSR